VGGLGELRSVERGVKGAFRPKGRIKEGEGTSGRRDSREGKRDEFGDVPCQLKGGRAGNYYWQKKRSERWGGRKD